MARRIGSVLLILVSSSRTCGKANDVVGGQNQVKEELEHHGQHDDAQENPDLLSTEVFGRANPELGPYDRTHQQGQGEPGAATQPVPGVRNCDGAQRNILVSQCTIHTLGQP